MDELFQPPPWAQRDEHLARRHRVLARGAQSPAEGRVQCRRTSDPVLGAARGVLGDPHPEQAEIHPEEDGGELFVTAGVVGAVWLWLGVIRGLWPWCPARAKARAAPPATTMATARTIASRVDRGRRDRLPAGT